MFLLLGIMVFPLVSADLIVPGYSPIIINNKITNIENYPDYVFVTSIDGDDFGPGYGMCPIRLVADDGTISSHYYKFCSVSVYAIKKSDIDLDKFNNDAIEMEDLELDQEGMQEFFNSLNPIEVISDIEHYKTAPITSTVDVENNHYEISLDNTKKVPDNQDIQRNYLIYFYIIIPIIAIIILTIILIKKYRK